MNPRENNEFVIGKRKYIYNRDNEWDHLIDVSTNEVKIHITFSKDEEKNQEAMEAIKQLLIEWNS